ncbi:von Willebrand factor [Roseimaritima multifibrata]|uniref:von Willebrand factor n=1 Tax=Roseimaritima multifibrata TaxID=1930274 RepID=A0A517MJV6_9BACT|nr:von Willebrand factor type A domain-containing protein [Roseimaritima multifibrata]QDS95169.1 von Willebrand factor [Roseimaritima multifibrata]
MTDLNPNDPRITEYVMEGMTAAERAEFEQQMAQNPELQEAVREVTMLSQDLRGLFGSEESPALDPARRQSIAQASVAQASPPAPIRTHSNKTWLSIAAIGIPLVACLAGGNYVYRSLQSGSTGDVAFNSSTDLGGDTEFTPATDAPTQLNVPDSASIASAEQPLIESVAESAGRKESERQQSQQSNELHSLQAGGIPGVPPRATEWAPSGLPGMEMDMEGDMGMEMGRGGMNMGMAGGMGTEGGMGMAGGGDAPFSSPSADDSSKSSDAPQPSAPRFESQLQPGTDSLSTRLAKSPNTDERGRGVAGMPAASHPELETYSVELRTTKDSAESMMQMVTPRIIIQEEEELAQTGFEIAEGSSGDRFKSITDNPFMPVTKAPQSTFSIDVDTASYSKVRSYIRQNHLPQPSAVRIEELINYFNYDYSQATQPEAIERGSAEGGSAEGANEKIESDDADSTPPVPFGASVEIAACPWKPEHRLARIGIQGREIANEDRPASNLVFLLDVSGSMNQPNKLPLAVKGMQMLLKQLGENDRVAIVVYASATGLVLDSTSADQHATIFKALERLSAGGSTNGGDGIRLAYNVARDHFIEGGVNRVLLCTDGDFNVGTTSTDDLVELAEKESKGGIFLSVLAFGMGNHNDSMLEQISNRGNGNYAFIDAANEAHKVFVQQTNSTLVTIAKDVKIQVEFNPKEVSAYRLIGYENRMLKTEDFNNDAIDAGEIGAGHRVTALYEITPAANDAEMDQVPGPDVDDLRYQQEIKPSKRAMELSKQAKNGELLTLKIRYKEPEGQTSSKLTFPVRDSGHSFTEASEDFQFASAVAGFGMQLRNSPYKGDWSLAAIEETAESASSPDPYGLRNEFIDMVKAVRAITGEEE